MWEAILASTVLRNMGLGAVALFLPIYLYQMGGMKMVVGYIAGSRLIEILVMTRLTRFIARVGIKKAMLASGFITALVLLCFEYAHTYPFLVWVATGLVPFSALLYWISYHLLFLETRKSEYGREVATLLVVSKWSGVLGPVVGGLLISVVGFGGLFWWGMALVVLSTIPIVAWGDDGFGWKLGEGDVWGKVLGGWFRRDFWAYFGQGIEEVMLEIIWPIYLIVILGGSHLFIGGYKTIVLLVSSLLAIWVGRRVDRGKAGQYMNRGLFLLLGMWLVRGVLVSAWGLLILDGIDGIVALFAFLPFVVYGYKRAKAGNPALYVVERELAINAGRGVAALSTGIIYWLGGGWSVMALVGAIGVALMSLLPKGDK